MIIEFVPQWMNRAMDREEGAVLKIIVRAIIANNNNMNYERYHVNIVAPNRFRPEFHQSQYTYVTPSSMNQ